jgi:serine/threonine protein kinase
MATIPSGQLIPLESGPVATVYSGLYAGLPVAVKVFPAKFDRRTLSAVEREQAKLAEAARSAPILVCDAVDQLDDGRHALRMELCSQSLDALVTRVGALAPSDAVVVGHALARALVAAHAAGVPHGGVTPHNVLFRASGEPVLADFGMTLREAFPRDPWHAIECVPPETVRSGVVDERTDLYGLGAVLHFALTGESPHPGRLGEQPGERVLRVLGSPVPAINRPDVPVALSTVVGRLLAADAGHRPRDAAWVVEQLSGLLPEAVPAVAPEPLPMIEYPAAALDFEPEPLPEPLPEPPLVAILPESPPGLIEPPIEDDFGVPMGEPEENPQDPADIDDGVAGIGTFARPAATPSSKSLRRYVVSGAAVLAVLVTVTLVLVLREDPDELETTPRQPPMSAPAAPASAAAVQLELADPVDLGDQVVLNWTSDRTLDFAVVIAGEGEPNHSELAQRNHTMKVTVDPVRKYCFLIQGSDGNQVYESQSKSIRGAVCHR